MCYDILSAENGDQEKGSVFDQDQKSIALLFAQKLAARDYRAALALCSEEIRSALDQENLGAEFEAIVPLDWGKVETMLEENDAFPFVYITLGGEVYSEAVIVHAFSTENGKIKIANFELGRP